MNKNYEIFLYDGKDIVCLEINPSYKYCVEYINNYMINKSYNNIVKSDVLLIGILQNSTNRVIYTVKIY